MTTSTPMRKNRPEAKPTEAANGESAALDMSQVPEGLGFENSRASDVGIPFILLLQGLSPVAQEGNPAYIEGAKAGMAFNSVTQALHDVRNEPMHIVPCHYHPLNVEWKPNRGGFVAAHKGDEILKQCVLKTGENGKKWKELPNKNIVEETAYWMVLVVSDPANPVGFPAVLALKSKGWKFSRQLMSQLQLRTMTGTDGSVRMKPMASSVVSIKSWLDSNEKGSFWLWKITSMVDNKAQGLFDTGVKFALETRDTVAALPPPIEVEAIEDKKEYAS